MRASVAAGLDHPRRALLGLLAEEETKNVAVRAEHRRRAVELRDERPDLGLADSLRQLEALLDGQSERARRVARPTLGSGRRGS